ncbi:MAG: ABC transporter ATP-binding protein, partial [Muribaculaceae bacterium]|nr:ABC transporter ATP-binding protein [Muribaculaceae bacterium]
TLLRLRTRLFDHMQTLPVNFFDRRAHGDVMSIYTNDVDSLRQMISQSLPNVFSSFITIAATLTSMLVLSWQLTIVTILLTTVMIFTTKRLSALSSKYFTAQQNNLGAVNGYVEEMLTGLKVVKTFNYEQRAIERFEQLNEQLRQSACAANRVSNIVMPINGNLSNLIYVACAVAGGAFALGSGAEGALTVGTLVSFLTLIKNFTQPVSQVSQQVNSVVGALAGAQRVFEVMDSPSEGDGENLEQMVTLVDATLNDDGSLAEADGRTGVWAWKVPNDDGSFTLRRQKGEVDFSHVDFAYVPGKTVLFDIDLDTDAGMKVALVGGTGAGKTTITNLINRFYEIQSGEILYDGIDITRIDRRHLRRSLGIVLQETHLFTGTVYDNIAYGRLDAGLDDCIAAAKMVHAHDFICRLPHGYFTMLQGDGGNLSQGERQLIAIARAAVANPPALILDEATSSIDTHTERLIQQGMDSLMAGRSSFVIAHRLSTIRNSDMIVVMDHGRIIERGTHQQLLALGGQYHRLYNV